MRAGLRRVVGAVSIVLASGGSSIATAQAPACLLKLREAGNAGRERRHVELRVVSAAGGVIEGAGVELIARGEGEVARGRTASDGRCVVETVGTSAALVRVTAAGHRPREVTVSGSAHAPPVLRVVLSVDPYRLPDLAARVAGVAPPASGRSKHAIRFGERPTPIGSLAEWLRSLPAVAVRGRGAGGEQVVSVRGSRPEGVLVLLDGMPLNSAMTGRADLSTIPVATLESAVLLPGTGSAAYGSGAGGGVLLLSSKSLRRRRAGAAVSVGSFGSRRLEAYGMTGGSVGRISVAANLAETANDYAFRNRLLPGTPQERRKNADVHSASISAVGATRWLRSAVRLDWLERGAPGRMGSALFDEARWRDAAWAVRLAAGGRGRRGSAAFRSRRREYRLSPRAEPERDRSSEVRLGVEQRLGGTVPVDLRLRLSHERVSGDRLQGSRRRTVVGASGSAELPVGPLRILPVVAVDVTSGVVALSPEISIEVGDESALRGWGRVGRGFRLPTFGDLYFASSQGVRPNPDLDPETVTLDVEVGAGTKSRVGDMRVEWSVSAHERRTRDPIVWLTSAAAVWSPRNLGQLRARGLELSGALARGDEQAAGWRVELAAGLEHSRLGFTGNGNPLPYQPDVQAHVTLEGWVRRFAARAIGRYTGSRTTSVAATRRLPGFALVDVSLSWRPVAGRMPLQVTVGVENVFDVRYELTELFPEPGRTVLLRFGMN